jgi:hypothetical protein
MIEQETVFILGAGASAPYGYPTGNGLRNAICQGFPKKLQKLLPISQTVIPRETLRGLIRDSGEFANTFDLSNTPSIDLFLARNPRFSQVGKIAIALEILTAEGNSRFGENVEKGQDWYSY